ncbi:hypothetical protein DV532_29530 (plasmid) [Pseudomonas sp. Leaf58]|uniref:hypothetical protein n=1 Tax=Pseudomonas sp. Leaf58 TaxID=1736226 RepID=UPI0006FCF400|nr:hypothetical protein [Pseudomonas sp. Leaf58]AYG48381.1 hypothetical protein DV532_29530 [Pseudomonas sp. Leaf58]KQN62072.1 hypothetical protein ASF02_07775 [Pseudomonas sp. Leaf58]
MKSRFDQILSTSLTLARQVLPAVVSKPKRHANALIAAAAVLAGAAPRMTVQQSQLIDQLFHSNPVFAASYGNIENCYALLYRQMEPLKQLYQQMREQQYPTWQNSESGNREIEILRLVTVVAENIDQERVQELLDFGSNMLHATDTDKGHAEAVGKALSQLRAKLGTASSMGPNEQGLPGQD